MKQIPVRPMAGRAYKEIPLDLIRVLNPRARDQAKFQEIANSIRAVGLRKPIVVNGRDFATTGFYDLVCGEGRYLVFKTLERHTIPAEVIDCSKKEALLYSLVENIARLKPSTMWFAHEIKRMSDVGYSAPDIATIIGRAESQVYAYIKLVEEGEERLIKGVEAGVFPMSFALHVVHSDTATVQNVLMDAYDSGIVSSANLGVVRKIIDARLSRGKKPYGASPGPEDPPTQCTMKQLKADIAKVTRDKEAFSKEAATKESRLLSLVVGLNTLWTDAEFVALAETEGLAQRPKVQVPYNT